MAELIDTYGRHLRYVRISVTDRCDFRCAYCMPEDGVPCMGHDEILRYEDISFLCSVFMGLGVRKFRFTGGEPLVRRGLVSFLADLKTTFPEMKLALTTNASTLQLYAERLARIGLHSLNISLDTLDPQKFAMITRVGSLDRVIGGIRAVRQAGITNIKLNTVLIRNFNDTEIGDLLFFSKKEGLLLRLIEFMPLEDKVWSEASFISGQEILSMLPDIGSWKAEKGCGAAEGPARYYVNERTGDTVGVIEAVSNHFCDSCNRLRVSASGALRTCLFDEKEIPMREMIKKRDRAGLLALILDSVRKKPHSWSDVKVGRQQMSRIGG